MLAEHSFTAVGRCPVDGCPDVYEVTVRASRVVFVEAILAARDDLTAAPRTQEDFTVALADRLGCQVETVGSHSGVRTRVVHGEISNGGES